MGKVKGKGGGCNFRVIKIGLIEMTFEQTWRKGKILTAVLKIDYKTRVELGKVGKSPLQ